MAEVRAFRALRYDEREAGQLEQLVAPPYDVISPEERDEYLARSPYNVVRLTLPESEDQAAREFADWQAGGVLVPEEPAFWALEQTYVGPDGVERTRRGLVGALKLEPYDRGVVLPHERTHAGPKEGRLRLLRAVRAQLEPIFLLYEGDPPYEHPTGEPALDVEGARLWPLDAPDLAEAFADKQLLIADGHHRYETALAFHDEDGSPGSAWMMVVLVSTSDPGLMIFPTHRVFSKRPEPTFLSVGHDWRSDPQQALRELHRAPTDRPAAVIYEPGRADLVIGSDGELDVEFVDRLGHEGISYTPDADKAVSAVDSGAAQVAVLMRPVQIEQVFSAAKAGTVLPQKSTYFYPKLLSGLLFQPL